MQRRSEEVTLSSMKNPQVLLASSSPRRREALLCAGLEPLVLPVFVDESPLPGEAGVDLVERLACAKARAVPDQGLPVVAGDTVVVHDGEIFGKPVDVDDARRMLEAMSGSQHQVISGWCVRRGEHIQTGHEITAVFFRDLTGDQLEEYLATGEPYDKAGAYGIQEGGGGLVERVVGSWSNVVGLPLVPVIPLLRDASMR